MRRNGAGTRLAAKVGLRGGGKFLPVIGEALMAYDAGSATYRLVKERRRGKKRGLGESAARVAGAAFISGEGVDWVEGKLRKRRNPDALSAERYLTLSYEDAPAHLKRERKTVRVGPLSDRQDKVIEASWVIPVHLAARLSRIDTEAMMQTFVERKYYLLSPVERERKLEEVWTEYNERAGRPFSSRSEYLAFQNETLTRFEKFMSAYFRAPPEVQRELENALVERRAGGAKGRIIDIRTNPRRCSRCKGTGRVTGFAHVEGGRCFACQGSGRA